MFWEVGSFEFKFFPGVVLKGSTATLHGNLEGVAMQMVTFLFVSICIVRVGFFVALRWACAHQQKCLVYNLKDSAGVSLKFSYRY